MLKETEHDYQGALCGNYYSNKMTGEHDSWNDFKNDWLGFFENDPQFKRYDDTYHFVFRYDIHKDHELYTLELCIMLQRKGIYVHSWIYNITEEELNGEVSLWLKGRLAYLKELWQEIDD